MECSTPRGRTWGNWMGSSGITSKGPATPYTPQPWWSGLWIFEGTVSAAVIKATEKAGEAPRWWETAWNLLESNNLSPFQQQAAVRWNHQGSRLWMCSLLSSRKSLPGVTVFMWLDCRGRHSLSCFKKGSNCSAHCASNYYWILFWNYGSRMINTVYFM